MSTKLLRPVFIAGSPRTGTTLMQNCLCQDPEVYRLGRESRFLWHRLNAQELTGEFPERLILEKTYLDELYRELRRPTSRDITRWARRSASQGQAVAYLDLDPEMADKLHREYPSIARGPFLGQEQGETAPFTCPPMQPVYASEVEGTIRIVDKDTGHCWRLSQLAETFPDACFIFMIRDAISSVTSIVNGWSHPTWFFTYRLETALKIRGYSDKFPWGKHWWNFNLFPGWEECTDYSLERLAAIQWEAAMKPLITTGLELATKGRAIFIQYEKLVENPKDVLNEVATFTGLDSQSISDTQLSNHYMQMHPGAQRVKKATAEIFSSVSELGETLSVLKEIKGSSLVASSCFKIKGAH